MTWSSVALGDLMLSRGGSISPNRFPDEEFELFSIPAHDRGGSEVVRGVAVGSPKQIVKPGDVMISKIVPHIRRARVVGRASGRQQVASGEWIVFRDDRVDGKYLKHFLVSDIFHLQFMATVAGVGGSLMRARPQGVKLIKMVLPPLDEQRRIAAILDQAEQVVAVRARAIELASTLGKSMFARHFGQPLDGSRRWQPVKLGDLARIIRGASPRPAGDPRYFGGPVPWLKISDVTAAKGRVVRQIAKGVTDAGRERSVLLPPGTLILTNSATVGIAKIIEPATCIHDGFLAFLDLDERVDQLWLWAALQASRDRLVALAPEGTQKNLNGPIVKAVELSLPPIEMQRQFALAMRGSEARLAVHGAALLEVRALTTSLKSRAFSSQL